MFIFSSVTHGGERKRNENVFAVKLFRNYFFVDFSRAVCEYFSADLSCLSAMHTWKVLLDAMI